MAMVPLGNGLPQLSKKLVERMLADEFIDLGELPPAKGRSRPPSVPEGTVVLLHAHDLSKQKRLIPDFATWAQCFAVYTMVLCSKAPNRLPDLLGYQFQLAKLSQRFKWPSWVIFDQNFRQRAAETGLTAWSTLDPTTFALCFTNQTNEGEQWCDTCYTVEHNTSSCPLKPLSRTPAAVLYPASTPQMGYPAPKRPKMSGARFPIQKEPCRLFNRHDGNCSFGDKCHFMHICSNRGCGGPHPITRCPSKPLGKR